MKDDSYGHHGHELKARKNINFQSLTYTPDESDVWRAHWALEHMKMRGRFWNHGKFNTIQTYFWIVMTGILQAVVAYVANFSSRVFIEVSKDLSMNEFMAFEEKQRAIRSYWT